MNTNRNEKGRFTSTTETTEETNYGFYSKLLNKPFDTLEELKKAESELRKAEEEKRLAADVKKADAEIVKKAISSRIEAEVKAKKIKADAYKEYLKACDEAEKLVENKKADEASALNEFCTKYKEGFHDTIKLGDITYTYDYGTTTNNYFLDPFKRFFGIF